jgi:hypothetical protein
LDYRLIQENAERCAVAEARKLRLAHQFRQLRHVGRDPARLRLQFTEALRLRELMWIASLFVFLD